MGGRRGISLVARVADAVMGAPMLQVSCYEDARGTLAAQAKWELATATFLQTKTPRTRTSYAYALRDFFAFVERTPDEVTRADVAAYAYELERRGNKKGTIACRLTAISSFYRFLRRPFSARGEALIAANPTEGVDRKRWKAEAYANARKTPLADVLRILAHLESLGSSSDPIALRDRALLLAYILTGRRRSEVVRITGRDLEFCEDGAVVYAYQGKGGKIGRRQLPPPVVEAIERYLSAAGRPALEQLEDAPVFVALWPSEAGAPLSRPDRILKARAKQAGIDPRRVKLHGLRHLAAELRRESGASIEEVSDLLDHSDLGVTTRYLKRIDGTRDAGWRGVMNLLEAGAARHSPSCSNRNLGEVAP